MREITSEIEIEASPAKVWSVLTDFPAHPSWNPFIKAIQGELRKGARLRVRLEPPGGRGMSFRPRLVVVEREKELRWLGHLGVPGILDGDHRFRITPLGAERVRFEQEEQFKGVLVAAAGGTLEKTKGGFDAMNEALKARAEAA